MVMQLECNGLFPSTPLHPCRRGKVDAADSLLNMDAHLDHPLPLLHRSLNEHDIEPVTAASFL